MSRHHLRHFIRLFPTGKSHLDTRFPLQRSEIFSDSFRFDLLELLALLGFSDIGADSELADSRDSDALRLLLHADLFPTLTA